MKNLVIKNLILFLPFLLSIAVVQAQCTAPYSYQTFSAGTVVNALPNAYTITIYEYQTEYNTFTNVASNSKYIVTASLASYIYGSLWHI